MGHRKGKKDAKVPEFVDDPLETITQDNHVEIEQKPKRQVPETEVRQELCGMYWFDVGDRLDLDDDRLLDDEIEAVPAVEAGTSIAHR